MLRQGRALLADGEMLFGGARDLLCGGERADVGQQPFAEKLDLRRVGPFRRANEVVAEIAVQYGVERLATRRSLAATPRLNVVPDWAWWSSGKSSRCADRRVSGPLGTFVRNSLVAGQVVSSVTPWMSAARG